MKVLRELLGSKKALAAIGTIISVLLAALGLDLPSATLSAVITAIASIGSIYVAAQGVADHGKEAEKVKVAGTVEALKAINPS